MSDKYLYFPAANETAKSSRRLVAAVGAAALLVGCGMAATKIDTDPSAKAQATTSSEQPASHESLSPSLKQFLGKVSNPQVSETYSVASATFTLKAGAIVREPNGNRTLTEPLDGILNPGWAPAEDGADNTLCFSLGNNTAACFDLDQAKGAISVYKFGSDSRLHEVGLDTITRENAVTATVQAVNDGFAFGVVEDVPQSLLGRPVSE